MAKLVESADILLDAYDYDGHGCGAEVATSRWFGRKGRCIMICGFCGGVGMLGLIFCPQCEGTGNLCGRCGSSCSATEQLCDECDEAERASQKMQATNKEIGEKAANEQQHVHPMTLCECMEAEEPKESAP